VAHLPATEPGTWEVTYEYGLPIPEGGRFAARQLVVEMVKACAGDATCRLPAGVASVTRRGVQVDFAGLEGRTGLYEVDQWVNAVNPKGGKLARVLAYDDPRFIRDRIGS
jgi:glycine/D-amino acid oxidase-like deaminating enzyme